MSRASQSGRVPVPESEKANPAGRIIKLVMQAGAKFFHTANSESFATVYVHHHWQTFRIKDAAFRHWIGSLFYQREKTVPSDEHVRCAINTLAGKALYEGREEVVHIRVAGHGQSIFLDLRMNAGRQ